MGQFKIYNSKTGKKEPVRPHNGKTGIYVCGVTPYDTTHLGHAFTYIVYDVLVRYLRFLGKKVVYVQNVTDVDDLLFSTARERKTTWARLAKKEMNSFLSDMDNLNWIRPDHILWSSDHIPEMIKITKKLVKKGLSYIKNGNVYFEVAKDPEFGQRLGRLNYSAMLELANERGNFPNDPKKRDPLDFVLWQKASSRGRSASGRNAEPRWSSPWGKGRPGWHIECSVMSTRYLGQPFSLHGGGADLKFPHHEAEISQSQGATGKPLADIFMHTAMVYYQGNKMSKSLGNMIFIRDLLKKYQPDAIRWLLLNHHYRNEWDYEEKELREIARKLEELTKMQEEAHRKPPNKTLVPFFNLLNNDFNTPGALEILFNLSKKYNTRELWEKIFGFNFRHS